MPKKKSRATSGGSHVRVTAAHKINKIEKELANLQGKPSAANAVKALLERLQFWKTKV